MIICGQLKMAVSIICEVTHVSGSQKTPRGGRLPNPSIVLDRGSADITENVS